MTFHDFADQPVIDVTFEVPTEFEPSGSVTQAVHRGVTGVVVSLRRPIGVSSVVHERLEGVIVDWDGDTAITRIRVSRQP